MLIDAAPATTTPRVSPLVAADPGARSRAGVGSVSVGGGPGVRD